MCAPTGGTQCECVHESFVRLGGAAAAAAASPGGQRRRLEGEEGDADEEEEDADEEEENWAVRYEHACVADCGSEPMSCRAFVELRDGPGSVKGTRAMCDSKAGCEASEMIDSSQRCASEICTASDRAACCEPKGYALVKEYAQCAGAATGSVGAPYLPPLPLSR